MRALALNLTFLLGFLWGVGLFANPSNRAVTDYLASEKVIRVYVATAPGNGHQASSVSVMRRLRELGFAGRFHVVYEKSTAKKLAFLLPGFDPNKEHQVLPDLNVEADLLNRQSLRKFPYVYLGVTGGADHTVFPGYIKVETLLRVSPWGWLESSVSHYKLGMSTEDPFVDCGVLTAIPRPSCLRAFAENHKGPSQSHRKTEGIVKILEVVPQVDFLPAYGLGVNGVFKLGRYMRGLVVARNYMPELFNKPIVIGLFSNMNDIEIKQLARFYSSQTTENKLELKIIDIDDKNLPEVLNNPDPQQILLVKVGVVAQEVFEYAFSKASLPGTVAGQNGTHLALRLGKPFINTGSTYYLEHFIDSAGIGNREAARIQDIAMFHISDTEIDDLVVARFLVEAKDQDSSLNYLMQQASDYYSDQGRDKLLLMLKEMLAYSEHAGLTPGELSADLRFKQVCSDLFLKARAMVGVR